jgi:hypothetical protein
LATLINGAISKTFLGRVKEGLTFRLDIKYSEGVVSYGNIVLEETLPGGIIAPTLLTGAIIAKLLMSLSIGSWEALPGTPVRLEVDTQGKILKIGHIYEDKWFNLNQEVEEYNKYVKSSKEKKEVEDFPAEIEDLSGPDSEDEEQFYPNLWG